LKPRLHPAGLCALAALVMLVPLVAQDAAPHKTATAQSTPHSPAKASATARPSHLEQAYPVAHNADGTETLVKQQPAAPKTTTPGAPSASQSPTTLPGAGTSASTAPKSAPDATAVAVAPKPPPPPPNPALYSQYLALLPAAPFNRNTIVLDAAHGGPDSGAAIGDTLYEKDIDLSLMNHLRSLLSARGFRVVTTRDTDVAPSPSSPSSPMTLDDRAGVANRAAAAACLLIHATGSGQGVHLYTSQLDAIPAQPVPAPWLTAQAAWVGQSQRLAASIATALGRSHIPLVSSTASIRPADSIACPVVIVELAPQDASPNSISDQSYQQKVAESIAGALVFWPNRVQPPARLLPRPPVTPTPTPGTTAAADGSKP
jgi:N-acetylmuramoyl-L-alanine amidase